MEHKPVVLPIPDATYKSPSDFTATFLSRNSLTIANLPAALTLTDVSQFVYVKKVSSGRQGAIFVNASGSCYFAYSAGVLTINGCGDAPIANGDKFEVGINGTDTVTISGDINVDSTSVSTTGMLGKASNGDFDTAYASGTTIACTNMPSYHATLIADDVVTVVQINTSGGVENTYTRDDKTMTVAGNVLTVVGATFGATDTFVIYTNVDRGEGFDVTQDSWKNLEQSPEKDWYTDAATLVTEQDLTATEDDLGSTIDVRGTKTLILYIAADCNNSLDVDLSAYTLDESGGDEYTSQDAGFTSTVTLWSGAGTDFFHEYRMDVNGHSFIQLKAIAGTVGVLPADLTIKIGKRY